MNPDPYSVEFEPLFLALLVVAAALYVRAARREGNVERWRYWLFGTGLVLVAAPVNSPLETLEAHYLLLMHLLQNALIADWAPPLLVIGLTPAMREAIWRRGGRPLARLARLRVALPLWLAVWYGVHLPFFYEWALRASWPLNFEHLLLLGAGLLFWWPALARRGGYPSPPLILAYLGTAFATSTFLALAFIFSSHAFYAFYRHAPRLWGLSPVKDQNLAGVLMQAEQTLVFLVTLGYFVARLFTEEEEAQREREREGQPVDGGRTRAGVSKS